MRRVGLEPRPGAPAGRKRSVLVGDVVREEQAVWVVVRGRLHEPVGHRVGERVPQPGSDRSGRVRRSRVSVTVPSDSH